MISDTYEGGYPPIDEKLLLELEVRYKLTTPTCDESLSSLMFRAGQTSVVEHLRYNYDLQNNRDSED